MFLFLCLQRYKTIRKIIIALVEISKKYFVYQIILQLFLKSDWKGSIFSKNKYMWKRMAKGKAIEILLPNSWFIWNSFKCFAIKIIELEILQQVALARIKTVTTMTYFVHARNMTVSSIFTYYSSSIPSFFWKQKSRYV